MKPASLCTRRTISAPSLLSLLGFSGVTILGVNATLNRFWLPLATLSAILLSYSLGSTLRSLEAVCRLPPSSSTAPADRVDLSR